MKTASSAKWWDKWDRSARNFDVMSRGIELRFGEVKRQWFARASGRVLLAAVGTGLDLRYFPSGVNVIGIDISSKMLDKAGEKLGEGPSEASLVRADLQMLGFADDSFDSVVTSCTFCSVPEPVSGLKELRRVLKPGGRLLMFEHVRSDISWMGPMMDLLTYASRRFGPDLNRRTRENIVKAGFELKREVNVYLDVVKLFEAVK